MAGKVHGRRGHDRRGLFQEADGGTLLLDEIGEMPQKMQTGLLRVLQERQVRPVGGTREEPVDVRVIAATHCDLQQMVADGTFREDLYYRLHVVELRVPALRERAEDIPPLVDHLISRLASRYRRDRKTVSREALRALCAFPWPGNVRQLEHLLLNAWLMSENHEIGVEDLELPVPARAPRTSNGDARPRSGTAPPARAETAAEHKAAIERERASWGALAACNWNRAAGGEGDRRPAAHVLPPPARVRPSLTVSPSRAAVRRGRRGFSLCASPRRAHRRRRR